MTRRKKNKRNRIIQKNIVRNIAIILILIVFLFVVYRFNFVSKSQLTETAKLNFKEFGENISIEEQISDIEVLTDFDGTKYILLPEKINGYFVQQYHITENNTNNDIEEELNNNLLENVIVDENTNMIAVDEIAGLKKYYLTSQEIENDVKNDETNEDKLEDKETNLTEDNEKPSNEKNDTPIKNTVEDNKIEEKLETNTVQTNKVETNDIITENEDVIKDVEKDENTTNNETENNNVLKNENIVDYSTGIKPGTRYNVYETDEKGKYTLGDVSIEVEYQVITNGNIKLYNQELTFEDTDSQITVTGYIPAEYTLSCTKESFEPLENEMNQYEDLKDYQMLCVYDIKVQNGENVYQPEEYDFAPSLTVNIVSRDLDSLQSEIDVKLIHFAENEIENIQNFEIEQNSVEFAANSFSKYAVISQKSVTEDSIRINTYAEDRNYYIGKNYTDSNEEKKYSDENLTKVNINYHGNRYSDFYNSKNEEKTSNYSSQNGDLQIEFGNDYYLEDEEIFNIPATIKLNNNGIINSNQNNWEITVEFTFVSKKTYLENVNMGKNINYKISGGNDNILKLSANNYDAWNETNGTLEFPIKLINTKGASKIEDAIVETKISMSITENVANEVTLGVDQYGFISAEEQKNLITYEKCVPKDENGNINIELIDNPFMDRPISENTKGETVLFGFDGWNSVNSETYKITTNQNNKIQTLTTKATDKEMIIDLYVDWKPANTIFVSQNGNGNKSGSSPKNAIDTFDKAVSKLNENKIYAENASIRELNIIVVTDDLQINTNNVGGYTITSLYNQYDYRQEAPVNITGNLTLNGDLQLEYLNIIGQNNYNTIPGDLTDTNFINGKSFNLRIGRGMTPLDNSENTTTFGQVQGGGDNGEFKTVIESGKYACIYADRGGRSTNANNHKTNSTLVIGTDYASDEELQVYYRISSRTTSGIIEKFSQNDKNLYSMYIKSGIIGIDAFQNNADNARYSGVYVGGTLTATNAGTYDNGNRQVIIEGGKISNVIGGLMVYKDQLDYKKNTKTYIYIKGNDANIQSVIGGAVQSASAGDRIIQITGGTIQYSVCAGSNGENSFNSDNSGELVGDTLLYIGGKANVGGDNRLVIANSKDNSKLYGLEPGIVLGAGNGNSTIKNAGVVQSSHIIIDGEANIKNNIYAGGNYGNSSSAQIDIFGGKNIGKNVYAGSNNSKGITENTEINMTAGTIEGTIYGGSNLSGTIAGNSTINISGGIIKGNIDSEEAITVEGETIENEAIFAGGYGNNTVVNGNTKISISNESNRVSIEGNIYGGSAMGSVNGTTDIEIKEVKDDNEISISGKIFGAGKGTEQLSAYNGGKVTVSVDGGNYPNLAIYGGVNLSGIVNDSVQINVGQTKDTYVADVYGGGYEGELHSENNSLAKDDTINLGQYARVENVFNGGNEAGIGKYFSQHININGATVGNVYGGSNLNGDVNTSNINCKDATITNIYGAGFGENTNLKGDTNIVINHSTINGSVYGGSYNGKTEGNTYINIIDCPKVNQVYGGALGENASVNDTNVIIKNSNVGTVYGGGKKAVVNGNTKLELNNVNISEDHFTLDSEDSITTGGNIFGAGEGENATVTGNTQVYISDNSIAKNIYGGGNRGKVEGSTFVRITSSTINESAFGAGKGDLAKNGKYALVQKGATIIAEENTIIGQNLFGGGDASNIGKTDIEKTDTYYNQQIDDANAYVYISGATIGGNVYGGSNRAKIFGDAEIYIGKPALDKEDVKGIQGKIEISGTVYGGGETKGDAEVYEYDFYSVNKDIRIFIDAENYDSNDENTINILGSVFGSGNNSNAQNGGTDGYGGSIEINNYGFNSNLDNIKCLTSIQRANSVKISNSKIKVEGTTDSTNQYASSNYTFNRISALTIKNDTTLYLKNGANLLAAFNSMMDVDGKEEPAEVIIGNNNSIEDIKGNNRIYAFDGKNINISNDEAVANNYGVVKGMTFFGIFTETDGKITAGMYSPEYNVGNSVLNWNDRYFHRTYVLGAHEANPDTNKNGFYTVYEKFAEESPLIKAQEDNTLNEEIFEQHKNDVSSEYKYINPTPEDAEYYMWYSGTSRKVHNFYIGENGVEPLRVSKYSTHGAVELPLTGISVSSATLKLDSFSIEDWNEIELKQKSEIPNIGNPDEMKFALVMETGNRGWLRNDSTEFLLTKDDIETCKDKTNYTSNYYNGSNQYLLESKQTPTLNFLLYNPKNITIENYDSLLGQYKLKMVLSYREGQSIVEEDVMIYINIKTIKEVKEEQGYNSAITYGKKYNLFPTALTNITTESSMSVFFELSEEDFKYSGRVLSRVLDMGYSLPKNTTITMIDKSGDTDKYYYYIVNEDGKDKIFLNEFKVMGNNKEVYDEAKAKYDDDILSYHYEAFIFIVDFSNADFNNTTDNILITNNPKVTLNMAAGNEESVGMLSSEGDKTIYNIFDTKCKIGIGAQPDNLTLYIGNEASFNVDTSFKSTTVTVGEKNVVTVYDTRYFDRKLGALITLYSCDEQGNEAKITDGLKGSYFEIDGKRYYPKSDGVTRVKMADIVSNVLTNISINTENSEDQALKPGKYKLKIEAFASADGIYYGTENEELPSDEINITIISNEYGLKSIIPENQVIIDRLTGYTLKENGYTVTESDDKENTNNLDVTLNYKYSVANPYITVELQRRKYDSYNPNNEDDVVEKVYSTEYTSSDIDLNEYLYIEGNETLKLTDVDSDKKIYEFLDTDTLEKNTEHLSNDVNTRVYTQNYKIRPNLKSGTYRLVFTLYDIKDQTETSLETPDSNTNTTNTETQEQEERKYQYIGEVYSYIIIK